jgi:hypothetical protein
MCICQTNLILEYLSDLPINERRMSAMNIVVIVIVKISAELRPYQQSGNFDKRAVAEKFFCFSMPPTVTYIQKTKDDSGRAKKVRLHH